MKGLRAGGLALVFGLKKHTVVNGKCVTLLRVVYPGQFFTRPTDGVQSVMEDDGGGCAWLVTGDVTTPKGHYGYGLFSPANLMPIDDGDPDGADELERGNRVGGESCIACGVIGLRSTPTFWA